MADHRWHIYASDPEKFGALEAPAPPGERDERLVEAVEALSDRQRTVVELHMWAQWSFRTIGAHLGLREGTVREHWRNALERLREQL